MSEGRALPDQLLSRVGMCIYCGATGVPLSDEHIVPAALNGNWVLADSVCETCQRASGGYESRFLQSIDNVRFALNFGASRQRGQHPDAPLIITIGGSTETIRLPHSDHPTVLMLPVFRRARALVDPHGDQSLQLNGDFAVLGYGPHPSEVAKPLNASGVTVAQKMLHEDFARLLAKIAYGKAVADLGLGAFTDIEVLPTILGQPANVGSWVGTLSRTTEPAEDPNTLHRVETILGTTMTDEHGRKHTAVLSRLTLFAVSSTPSPLYEVLIGIVDPDKLPPRGG